MDEEKNELPKSWPSDCRQLCTRQRGLRGVSQFSFPARCLQKALILVRRYLPLEQRPARELRAKTAVKCLSNSFGEQNNSGRSFVSTIAGCRFGRLREPRRVAAGVRVPSKWTVVVFWSVQGGSRATRAQISHSRHFFGAAALHALQLRPSSIENPSIASFFVKRVGRLSGVSSPSPRRRGEHSRGRPLALR